MGRCLARWSLAGVAVCGLLLGCVDEQVPFDGLDDDDDDTLGTDPGDTDTDGDRYDDGVEVEAGTDPLEYYQHPFIGGYPPGPGPVWQGTGFDVGDVIDNVTLLDQHAEPIDLWALSGWALTLVFGAPW